MYIYTSSSFKSFLNKTKQNKYLVVNLIFLQEFILLGYPGSSGGIDNNEFERAEQNLWQSSNSPALDVLPWNLNIVNVSTPERIITSDGRRVMVIVYKVSLPVEFDFDRTLTKPTASAQNVMLVTIGLTALHEDDVYDEDYHFRNRISGRLTFSEVEKALTEAWRQAYREQRLAPEINVHLVSSKSRSTANGDTITSAVYFLSVDGQIMRPNVLPLIINRVREILRRVETRSVVIQHTLNIDGIPYTRFEADAVRAAVRKIWQELNPGKGNNFISSALTSVYVFLRS